MNNRWWCIVFDIVWCAYLTYWIMYLSDIIHFIYYCIVYVVIITSIYSLLTNNLWVYLWLLFIRCLLLITIWYQWLILIRSSITISVTITISIVIWHSKLLWQWVSLYYLRWWWLLIEKSLHYSLITITHIIGIVIAIISIGSCMILVFNKLLILILMLSVLLL